MLLGFFGRHHAQRQQRLLAYIWCDRRKGIWKVRKNKSWCQNGNKLQEQTVQQHSGYSWAVQRTPSQNLWLIHVFNEAVYIISDKGNGNREQSPYPIFIKKWAKENQPKKKPTRTQKIKQFMRWWPHDLTQVLKQECPPILPCSAVGQMPSLRGVRETSVS